MMNLNTWNMQGASHSTENKWNSGVKNLLQIVDICCLQECGDVPASAKIVTQNVNGIKNLDLYSWGTDRAKYWILFINTDVKGNRTNLAIVSKDEPDDFYCIYPQKAPIYRPAIGIELDSKVYFSFHAISPKGPDAKGLLAAVDANCTLPWYVGADYNREPDSLTGATGIVCPPDNYTYSTSKPHAKYDYMVRNAGKPIIGEVQDIILSDHYPVIFNLG